MKFQYLADKTITRMMIHSDKNLSLLPLCLDKIRNHSRVMKKWRSTLDFVNGLLRPDEFQIYRRFKKWKDFYQNKKDALHKIPFKELILRSDQNKIELINKADDVDLRNDALNQFKEQRDLLLTNLIRSQKLALSSMKHNYERA